MALDLVDRKTLMTLEEVAEVLRVSVHTVKKLAAAGKLFCVKVGRRRLFRPEHVYQYIVTHTRQFGVLNG